MRAITVYRVDYSRKTKYSVGVVLEQRKTERGENLKDLLRLARQTFALDTADAVHIVIDVSQAQQAYRTEPIRGCSGDRSKSFNIPGSNISSSQTHRS